MFRAAIMAGLALLFGVKSAAQITSFPFEEHFDNSASLPPDWESNGFSISASSPRSSPNCASATGNIQPRRLVSPVFNFSERVPQKLTFAERRSSSAVRFRLSLAAVNDDSSAIIPLGRWDTIATASAYVLRSVDTALAKLRGVGGLRFVFDILRDSTNSTGVLRLDDIQITAEPTVDLSLVRVEIAPVAPDTRESISFLTSWRSLGIGMVPQAMLSVSVSSPDIRPEVRNATTSIGPTDRGDSGSVAIAIGRLPSGKYQARCAIVAEGDEIATNDSLSLLFDVSNYRGALVITEIMNAPVRTDEPEWIELLNPGPDTVSLTGMTLSDVGDTRAPIATTSFIDPGEYIVVSKSQELGGIYPIATGGLVISAFASLSNTTSDAVVLRDFTGRTIDSVRYEPGWSTIVGRSLERKDYDLPSTMQSSWQSSIDTAGGTPGRVNSVQRAEVDLSLAAFRVNDQPGPTDRVHVEAVIRNIGRTSSVSSTLRVFADTSEDSGDDHEALLFTEHFTSPAWNDSLTFGWDWIKPPRGDLTLKAHVDAQGDTRKGNDTAFAGLRLSQPRGLVTVNEIMFDPIEGQNEWVEILNTSGRTVNIGGWIISDRPSASGSSSKNGIWGGSTLVGPHCYAVVAAESTVISRYPWLRDSTSATVVILHRASGLGLNDDGDAVIIRDATGATIDSVLFDKSSHIKGIGTAQGRSLERITPTLDGTSSDSWSTSSHALGGTPGLKNSVSFSESVSSSSVIVSPNPFSPDGDGFEDLMLVHFSVPSSSSFVTARLFDIQGRLVRTVADRTLLPGTGSVGWDGRFEDGRRVPVGIYVLLFEASGTTSNAEVTKKLVVAVAR